MSKLDTILIAILVFMFASAGVYAYIGYSGNEAMAVHYMTQQEWKDSSCIGCHLNVYDEVSNSYHVQQNLPNWASIMEYGVTYDSMNADELAKTYGQIHPGGGYMAEHGLNVDCMVCHEQQGLYDFHARANAISTGNAAGANDAALANGRSSAQKSNYYVMNYMLDVLTPLPIVTEIHDHLNGAPRNEQCASCHGSDVCTSAASWASPDHAKYDVHANLQCSDCHVTKDHQIGRKNMTNAPAQMHDAFSNGVTSCYSAGCHAGISHGAMADGHLTLTCESCHIPALPAVDISGNKPMRSFSWANGVREVVTHDTQFTPVLAWYSGTYYDQLPVRRDRTEDAKLKPFNVINGTWWDTGKDPAIVANPNSSSAIGNPILPAHVKAADTNKDGVVTQGEMRAYDADGNGLADYPNAVLRHVELYYPVSHNIASSNKGLAAPLTCGDCHGTTANIDWRSLGFVNDPAGADQDYSEKDVSVSIPGQKPVEVQKEPVMGKLFRR